VVREIAGACANAAPAIERAAMAMPQDSFVSRGDDNPVGIRCMISAE
jgi:hypothetical protein